MSQSITVGLPAENLDGHFKVDASVKDVHVRQGQTSRNVQVGGRANEPRAAQGAAPKDSPTPIVGNTVRTAHGDATVHRTVAGQALVTLPGAKGVQMSLQEARAAGIIVADGEPAGGKPSADAPKDPEEKTDGAEDKTDGIPTVTPEELQAHATELNAVGDAFSKAGLNPEDALSRAVEDAAKDGTIPEDVSSALLDAFGDDSQTVVDNAYSHTLALAADAVAAAGLSPEDADTMAALDQHMAANWQVFISALRGQPQALNRAVAAFAKSRR